jgi:hypothetical protein
LGCFPDQQVDERDRSLIHIPIGDGERDAFAAITN